MPWNEPGGSKDKDKDPWSGQSSRSSNDNSIEGAIQKMNEKLGDLLGGGRSGGSGDSGSGGAGFSSGILLGLLGILLLGWLATGIYTVDSAERGVELRFGEYSETTQPGLHWHLPWPIETVEKVDIDRNRTARDPNGSTQMLTKDENIISIGVTVQYKIKEPSDYLFNVFLPDYERNQTLGTVYNVMRSAVREVVGGTTMDSIIGADRELIAPEVLAIMQSVLDEYKSGIDVIKVNITEAEAPAAVKDAFDDAIRAREDQNRFKNQAETYAKQVVPNARGKAARIKENATAYRSQLIAKAQGEASRFDQLATAYSKAPDVTRERLYLETMEAVLEKSSKVMIDSKGGDNMLYLPLDKLQGMPGASTGAQGGSAAAAGAAMSEAARRMQGQNGVTESVRSAIREGR